MEELSTLSRTKKPGIEDNLNSEVFENRKELENGELQEIFTHLSITRKKHDQLKQSNIKKKKELEDLKKELTQLETIEEQEKTQIEASQTKIQDLEATLEITRDQITEQLNTKKSYEHMLKRTRLEKVSINQKTNQLSKTLKSTQSLLESEEKNRRRTRETLHKSLSKLKEVQKNYKTEEKKKQESLQSLNKNMQYRQEAALRREQRTKRQKEVAELAANGFRNSKEIYYQEQVLIHRFWHLFMKKKYRDEQSASMELVEAFDQIRASTGIPDPKAIVARFTNRETYYKELLEDVSKHEEQLDQIKEKSEHLRKELKEVALVEGQRVTGNPNKEFSELNEAIESELKHYEIDYDNLKEAEGLMLTTLEWAKRIGFKLGCKYETPEYEPLELLQEIFKAINENLAKAMNSQLNY